jgi:uncharacterized membrane protein YcaP (DUF421 family)
VTRALTVIATIALLSVFVAWIAFRFKCVRLVTDGEPIILVRDCQAIESNLQRERLTVEELEEEARQQQIESIAGIRRAILETDGQASCIPKKS